MHLYFDIIILEKFTEFIGNDLDKILFLCYEVPEKELLSYYFINGPKGMAASLKPRVVTNQGSSDDRRCLTAFIRVCGNHCVDKRLALTNYHIKTKTKSLNVSLFRELRLLLKFNISLNTPL